MANSHIFALAILMLAGTLILSDYQVSAQCGVNFSQLVSQCSQYVTIPGPKIPPSEGCCTVLKPIDIPCACKYVTPDIEKLVSMDKAVYVGRTCGLKIEPGTKCGSYTVPPGLKI
ncbi:hypothetical protein ACOSP7_017005 [Xanthoceras sorbifolium]|uniref:Bifunctional inhibitor/plant lipid transfer protein/seed storage helical domain-containing protein n=1 Tax=Xanthoceras sorbifolium TaxID=99658 RepID=A0ABQ8HHY1_9ROSI|nr:hypothetical protein JRO89_XS10G0071600 [Xanthoceras sorbifolium]